MVTLYGNPDLKNLLYNNFFNIYTHHMEKTFITEEEKNTLSTLQQEADNLIINLGQIEYQIQALHIQKDLLKDSIVQHQKNQAEFGNQLQTKYGNGNIDPSTGEFIKS